MGNSTTALSTALTEIRDFLDEPMAQQWSDTQLTSYINLGQADVQRKSEALRQMVTLEVLENVQKYVAPSDILRIYRLEYIPSGSTQTYGLEFRGYNEMDAVWGTYQQYTGAFPSLYTLWCNPPRCRSWPTRCPRRADCSSASTIGNPFRLQTAPTPSTACRGTSP